MLLTLPSLKSLDPKLTHDVLLDRLRSSVLSALTTVNGIDRNSPFWDEDIDIYIKYADKAAVEAALFLLIASRIPSLSQGHKQILVELRDQLIPLIWSERNQALLMRFPQSAAAFGIGHVAFAHNDAQNSVFDFLVRRAFQNELVNSVERVPYRAMDVRWLRGLLFPDLPPNFDDLFPHSILVNHAHPIYMSPTDIYALTHALMYLTDFGTRPLPKSLELDQITTTVDACIASNLLIENLDLLGELLICASLLELPWSPYTRYAWSVLFATWQELGFLPSPTFETTIFSSLGGREKVNYAHRHTYHTTFVGGMLSAILLRHPADRDDDPQWMPPVWTDQEEVKRQCNHTVELASAFCGRDTRQYSFEGKKPMRQTDSPPIRVDANADHTLNKTINHILSYLGVSAQENAPWIQAATAASYSDDELILVLIDALLIQACRDYNLGELANVLVTTVQNKYYLTTTFREATLFLVNQQLPSGAIGAHFVVPQNNESPNAILITQTLADCLTIVGNSL